MEYDGAENFFLKNVAAINIFLIFYPGPLS